MGWGERLMEQEKEDAERTRQEAHKQEQVNSPVNPLPLFFIVNWSVAEPEPMEPQLFEIWRRSQNYFLYRNIY